MCVETLEDCFTLSSPVFLQALEVSDHYPVEVLLKNSSHRLLFCSSLSRETQHKGFSVLVLSPLVLLTLPW